MTAATRPRHGRGRSVAAHPPQNCRQHFSLKNFRTFLDSGETATISDVFELFQLFPSVLACEIFSEL